MSTFFILKICFLKHSFLVLFIVCSAIAVTEFITAKKRCFFVRAAEHMGISYLTNKCLKNFKQSAVSDHLWTCDCKINFIGFNIFSKDFHNLNLFIKEILLIARDKIIFNKTVKSFPLDLSEYT